MNFYAVPVTTTSRFGHFALLDSERREELLIGFTTIFNPFISTISIAIPIDDIITNGLPSVFKYAKTGNKTENEK